MITNANQRPNWTGGPLLLYKNHLGFIKCSIMCLVVQFLVAPEVTISPDSKQDVEYRETATFNCTASGNPSPTITWRFANKTLTFSKKYGINTTESSSILVVKNLSRNDNGSYECRANNTVGKDSKTSQLIVLSK